MILHVGHVIKGGQATFFRNWLELTSDIDEEQLFVLPESAISDIAHNKVVAHKSGGRIKNIFYSLFSVLQITRANSNIRIVYFHSFGPGVLRMVVFLWIKLLRRNTELFYNAHGWSFFIKNPTYIRRFLYFFEAFMALFTHKIIACSGHDYDFVKNRFPFRGKVLEIPYGLKPTSTQYVDRGSEKISIGFIGRYDEQKGFDTFCEAALLLESDKRYTFYCAGSYVLGETSEIPKFIVDVGWLQPNEINNYLSKLDIVVLPSRWEGYGMVATEAMMAGCYVISSRIGGLPEQIRENVTGVSIANISPAKIASSIVNARFDNQLIFDITKKRNIDEWAVFKKRCLSLIQAD